MMLPPQTDVNKGETVDSAERRTLGTVMAIALMLVGQARGQIVGRGASDIPASSQLAPRVPAPQYEDTMLADDHGELVPPPPPLGDGVADVNRARSVPQSDGLSFESDRLLDEGFVLDSEKPLFFKHRPLFHDTGTWFFRGHWYTRHEFVAMVKKRPNNRIFATDTSSYLNTQRLTPDSDPHGYEPGVRITVGNIIGRDQHNNDHALEFTFFGLFDFSSFARLRAREPGSINTAVAGVGFGYPGFDEANGQVFQYDSDLNSLESNLLIRSRLEQDQVQLQPNGKWVRHSNPGSITSYKMGFRYMSLNERFLYTSRGPNDGDLDTYTYNDMFGPQVGGEYMEQYENFSVGASAMAGGLYNFAGRKTRLTTQVDGRHEIRAEESIDDQLTFVGDFRVFGAFHLRPHMTLRASYQVLLVAGIATAVDQVFLKPAFPEFDTRGDAFYHAVSFGFEQVW